MRGCFRDHHPPRLGAPRAHLELAIAPSMTKWKVVTVPFAETRDRLDTITGVGKRAAECVSCARGNRPPRATDGSGRSSTMRVAAARSRDTYLSAQFWRLAPGTKAAVAVGHSILGDRLAPATHGFDYEDLGGDYLVQRDTDRACQRAVAQL